MTILYYDYTRSAASYWDCQWRHRFGIASKMPQSTWIFHEFSHWNRPNVVPSFMFVYHLKVSERKWEKEEKNSSRRCIYFKWTECSAVWFWGRLLIKYSKRKRSDSRSKLQAFAQRLLFAMPFAGGLLQLLLHSRLFVACHMQHVPKPTAHCRRHTHPHTHTHEHTKHSHQLGHNKGMHKARQGKARHGKAQGKATTTCTKDA